MAKRSLDQMIGLVGGLIGIIMGAIGLLIHRLISSFPQGDAITMILFSVIGLVGAFLVTSRKKDAGMIMLVIGLAGIIALPNYVTVVPFLIILVAGIVSRL
jgi:hypothetical protein